MRLLVLPACYNYFCDVTFFKYLVEDKDWQREQRQQAVDFSQKRAAEREEKKREQKRELEKFGVKQQMNVSIRSRIEYCETEKNMTVKSLILC